MNKTNNLFEIIVGTFVLISAIMFLINSFGKSNINDYQASYIITAKFDNVDGISSGSDVKISGIKIGSVNSFKLDEKDFRAVLTLSINDSVKLPYDSSVKVSSEGLLGSKYLSITPGADEEFLQNGEQLDFTQSSINLEDLLGKFIFNSSEEKKGND